MEKFFVSIEYSCDPDDFIFDDDRIIVIRKRWLIFSTVIKGFGSYDVDIKKFAREYCNKLNKGILIIND